MIVLDTTFLVDYLDGDEATRRFLEEHRAEAYFTATLSLFEVYRGGARVGGREVVDRIAEGLSWIAPLELSEETAREASMIEAERRDAGRPINLGDVLIAGVCRHHGGELVTRDADFADVDGLQVTTY